MSKGKFKIFIVDDDPWYGEMLEYYLSMNPEYELCRYTTAKECLANLHQKPGLITLDYGLPDGNGTTVLKKILQTDDTIPVVIISAQEDISTAIGLLRAGARDYIPKDEHTKDLLWNAVIRIREHQELKEEVDHLKQELGQRFSPDKMIKGNSSAMQKVFQMMEKARHTNINVSISGETGTGKEVVAKAIHYNSNRNGKSFVAVNMAAIPKELIESELFGHEKGSFTGAVARKIGRFEQAHQGTLFLDEIAELDLSLQAKLLRVIQERELVRVGGNERIKLDVRIITATHRDLAQAVQEDTFREDLYYRLIGLPLTLPPLRDRESDIILLAKSFLEEFCKANKLPALTINTAAKNKLMSYPYPGNVRELKAIIELAAVMSSDGEIREEDITFTPVGTSKRGLIYEEKTLQEYTIDIISAYLRKYDNNVVRVADKLDIGKSTIYKLIKDKAIVI